MKQAQATLLSKKILAVDVYSLYFYTEGFGFGFIPGQYVVLDVPSSSSPIKRLYSFAGSNSSANSFELLVKLVPGGVASEYLRGLSIGDKVDVSGPAGLFLEQKTLNRKIYMTTGTGFAPIRSFLLSKEPGSVNGALYWGLKDLAETYLFDELRALQQDNPLFSFSYCLSQQVSFDSIPADLLHYYRAGHIDAAWGADFPTINSADEYYLCGSRTVIESLRLLLLSKGVLKTKLFFEKY